MKLLALLFLLSFNVFAQEEEESEYLRALRLSCDKQKVALGCFNYANALMRNGNEEAAEKYFALGCKQEHSPSCKKEKWDLPAGLKPAKAPVVESATTTTEATTEATVEATTETPVETATETVPETEAATTTEETSSEATIEATPETATEPEAEALPESLDLDLDSGSTINE
jgi:hypothetical protein